MTKRGTRPEHNVRSEAKIEEVKEKIKENPGVSMRRLSAETGVSRASMGRIVHKDLHLTSYHMRRGQILSAVNREARYVRARALLNKLKCPKSRGDHECYNLIFVF